jgi:hypothetical protein
MRPKVWLPLDEIDSPGLADRRCIAISKQSLRHFFNITQSRRNSL